jgi:hypothetical protein
MCNIIPVLFPSCASGIFHCVLQVLLFRCHCPSSWHMQTKFSRPASWQVVPALLLQGKQKHTDSIAILGQSPMLLLTVPPWHMQTKFLFKANILASSTINVQGKPKHRDLNSILGQSSASLLTVPPCWHMQRKFPRPTSWQVIPHLYMANQSTVIISVIVKYIEDTMQFCCSHISYEVSRILVIRLAAQRQLELIPSLRARERIHACWARSQ